MIVIPSHSPSQAQLFSTHKTLKQPMMSMSTHISPSLCQKSLPPLSLSLSLSPSLHYPGWFPCSPVLRPSTVLLVPAPSQYQEQVRAILEAKPRVADLTQCSRWIMIIQELLVYSGHSHPDKDGGQRSLHQTSRMHADQHYSSITSYNPASDCIVQSSLEATLHREVWLQDYTLLIVTLKFLWLTRLSALIILTLPAATSRSILTTVTTADDFDDSDFSDLEVTHLTWVSCECHVTIMRHSPEALHVLHFLITY